MCTLYISLRKVNGKANIGMCSAGVCSSSSSSVTDHLMWVKCLYYHLYILQVVSTHFIFTRASILTLLQVTEAFQNIFQVWKCDLDFRCDWLFECLTAMTAWRLWQYDCHKRIMPGHLSASVSLKQFAAHKNGFEVQSADLYYWTKFQKPSQPSTVQQVEVCININTTIVV